MSTATLTDQAQEYLEALAEELAISNTRYEQAETSYHSLGNWLNRDASSVRQFKPAVYVQGSFGLGTVIRPLSDAEEYDVDSVCELKALDKTHLSQAQLKELVGHEIEAYRVSQNMTERLREGRRCWTLNYAKGAQFHMDVVPALPNGNAVRVLLEAHHANAQWADTAIGITDNEAYNYQLVSQDWPRSNPKGYLQWFKSRMVVTFEKRRRQIAEAVHASVEDIPDYRVRTPLQSAIMILKRHRDIMFCKDEINCCPISIIITTLAAHAYEGQDEIAPALLSILNRMDDFILHDGNKYIIPNPTDPLENFADKWEQFPERADSFFAWLEQARRDFQEAAALFNRRQITEVLASHMGENLTKRAETRAGGGSPSGLLRAVTGGGAVSGATAPSFGSVPRVPTKPQGFA